MRKMIVELDEELHHKVKVKAARENASMKDVVTGLLEEYVRK